MSTPPKPLKFPMRCRTAAGRAKLIEYTRIVVKESLQALVRSKQYWTFTALECAFEIHQKAGMVLVEIGTVSGPRGSIVVKVWVNSLETTLARLHHAVIAAFDGDDDDSDDV